MKKHLAVALLAAVGLTGCTSEAPRPEPTKEAPAAPVETKSDQEQLRDAQMRYCKTWWATDAEYMDFITEMMNAGDTFDAKDWPELDRRMKNLNAQGLSPGWQADHVKYLSVRKQINEAIAGDGNASINTDDWKAGVIGIMDRCVDAGFKVDG